MTSFFKTCKSVSDDDLKGVPGLVNSKSYFVPRTDYVEASERERREYVEMRAKAGRPVSPGTKVRIAKPWEEPAKVIRLGMAGYPSIDYELIAWPVKKDERKRLCDEISSFYLEDGVYYTDKLVSTTSTPSKSAKVSERGSSFDAIDTKAAKALLAGKTRMHTVDKNGVKAIQALKWAFGTR